MDPEHLQFSDFYQGPKLFNSLPIDVTGSLSLESFKKKLKEIYSRLSIYFTIDENLILCTFCFYVILISVLRLMC